jgi:large subunit ribosomal protein L7/L12
MAKIEALMTSIGELTVIELSDLVKALEEKFGVTAAAPVAVAVAGGAAAGAVAEEVKDEVDVILTGVGSNKIQVLKVVREITGLGLKEAKDLVDTTPKPVKSKIKKAEADEIKKKIEEQGGTVEIK